jgi:hypothetical protein
VTVVGVRSRQFLVFDCTTGTGLPKACSGHEVAAIRACLVGRDTASCSHCLERFWGRWRLPARSPGVARVCQTTALTLSSLRTRWSMRVRWRASIDLLRCGRRILSVRHARDLQDIVVVTQEHHLRCASHPPCGRRRCRSDSYVLPPCAVIRECAARHNK